MNSDFHFRKFVLMVMQYGEIIETRNTPGTLQSYVKITECGLDITLLNSIREDRMDNVITLSGNDWIARHLIRVRDEHRTQVNDVLIDFTGTQHANRWGLRFDHANLPLFPETTANFWNLRSAPPVDKFVRRARFEYMYWLILFGEASTDVVLRGDQEKYESDMVLTKMVCS